MIAGIVYLSRKCQLNSLVSGWACFSLILRISLAAFLVDSHYLLPIVCRLAWVCFIIFLGRKFDPIKSFLPQGVSHLIPGNNRSTDPNNTQFLSTIFSMNPTFLYLISIPSQALCPFWKMVKVIAGGSSTPTWRLSRSGHSIS